MKFQSIGLELHPQAVATAFENWANSQISNDQCLSLHKELLQLSKQLSEAAFDIVLFIHPNTASLGTLQSL